VDHERVDLGWFRLRVVLATEAAHAPRASRPSAIAAEDLLSSDPTEQHLQRFLSTSSLAADRESPPPSFLGQARRRSLRTLVRLAASPSSPLRFASFSANQILLIAHVAVRRKVPRYPSVSKRDARDQSRERARSNAAPADAIVASKRLLVTRKKEGTRSSRQRFVEDYLRESIKVQKRSLMLSNDRTEQKERRLRCTFRRVKTRLLPHVRNFEEIIVHDIQKFVRFNVPSSLRLFLLS